MSESKTTSRVHVTNGFKDLPIEGALDAPVLYFDEAPCVGAGPSICSIVLCAFVQETNSAGTVTVRKKAIAHLRGSHKTFGLLRGAINRIEQMMAPAEGPSN